METRSCTRWDYEEMLRMLNDAFDHAGEPWFEKNLSIATPYLDDATDEMIGRHYIAIEDGEIIGCVGAYPRTLFVAEGKKAVPIPVYGIGQVACDRRYRGRGVMTALLNLAVAGEEEKGAVFGWLHGLRSRYGHFGFDFGGRSCKFTINAQSLPKPAGIARRATLADIPVLNCLHERFPTRMERDRDFWRRLITNEKDNEYIIEGYISEDGAAYSFFIPNSNTIAEINGETGAALLLAADIAAVNAASERLVRVWHPNTKNTGDDMYDALYSVCADFITAPACLSKFSPKCHAARIDDDSYWVSRLDNI